MGGSLTVPNLEIEEVQDDPNQDALDQGTHPDGEGQEGTGGEGTTGTEKKITVPSLNLDTDDSEAITQLLSSAGVTSRANVEQLINNNNTFTNFFRTLETDPVAAVEAIGRVNPRLRDRIYEEITEDYIRKYESTDDAGEGTRAGDRGRGRMNNANPEVLQLREQLTKIQQRLDAGDQQTQYQSLRTAFANRVSAYFEAGDLKDLTAADKRNLKARLKESLAEDGDAFQRIQRGSFIDIPKHLQKVLDEYTAETRDDQDRSKNDREKVAAGARKDIAAGPGVDSVTGRDTASANKGDIWDDAVNELAADLKNAKSASSKRGRK